MTNHAINRLQLFVYGLALAIMIGWLLLIGRGIILPIVAAILLNYMVSSISIALGNAPVLRLFPRWVNSLFVLLIFIGIIGSFALIISSTTEQLLKNSATYQSNLENLAASVAIKFGVDVLPEWGALQEMTIGRINIRDFIGNLASSVSSAGTTIFLILIYATFLAGERGRLATRMLEATGDRIQAKKILSTVEIINNRVGRYLVAKSFINLILALISYIFMKALDIDFALFWAVLIGVTNYIPYVGSLIGVAFPVVFSILQFGKLEVTILALGLLVVAQNVVGYVIEPRIIGRSVNLTPFVVMVALSLWGALWGIPGAILAIPLTTTIIIILSNFEATKPLAVLLSDHWSEHNKS